MKNIFIVCLIALFLLTGCLVQPTETPTASPTIAVTPAPTSLRVLPTVLPSATPTRFIRPSLVPSATIVPTEKPPLDLGTRINRDLTRWAATPSATKSTAPIEFYNVECLPYGPAVSITGRIKNVSQRNLVTVWIRAAIYDAKNKQINTSKWLVVSDLFFSGRSTTFEALVPDPYSQMNTCNVTLDEFKYQ